MRWGAKPPQLAEWDLGEPDLGELITASELLQWKWHSIATGTLLRKSSAYAAGEKYGCDTDFLIIPLSSFSPDFLGWMIL